MGLGLLVGLVLVTAACGDDDEESTAAAGTGATDIAVREGTSVGTVLVDADGMTLYTTDEEADGTIRCVDECAAIWLPVTVTSAAPSAPEVVADEIGTVARPDGSMQATFAGQPLYRFSFDEQPGDVTGEAVADTFAGTEFVWHAVTTGAAATQPPPTTAGGGYGY
jgi:predicted lipoprotein with Yx(FWY)xxD motif